MHSVIMLIHSEKGVRIIIVQDDQYFTIDKICS